MVGALALIGALSFGIVPQVTVAVRDVAYASGPQRTLDLSVPATRGWPTLLFVHGGGLTQGDKRDDNVPAMCDRFAALGVGCASMNYRLGPAIKWPAQPEDVASAVAWLRHNIGAHGGDSTSIVLMGHSSGCALAASVATDARYLATQRLTPEALRGVIPIGCLLEPVPPAVRDSARLRCFFVGSAALGTFGSLETFLDVNPVRHAGPQTPPTLVLVAEGEQLQPPILEHARAFEARMKQIGRPVRVEILPARGHMTALQKMAEPRDQTFELGVGFVRDVVRR
jgi:arylformamidase